MPKEFKETFPECVKCGYIPCINLFKSWDELEGEELFLLSESIRRGKVIPCIIGVPIYTLCQCTRVLAKNEETANLPIVVVLHQCIRDLKCSTFLALCGHYRNAMQILRPLLENFLAGLYFTYTETPTDFQKWIQGDYKIPASLYESITGEKSNKKRYDLDWKFCLMYFIKHAVREEYRKRWMRRMARIREKIIAPLNKYLHARFEVFEIASPEKCAECPASVKYDKEWFDKWIEITQRILYIIFEYLLAAFGDELIENEQSREALFMLTHPIEVERELHKQFLKYEEYRKLIKLINETIEEYEKTKTK